MDLRDLPTSPPFPGAVLASSCLFHGVHRMGIVERWELGLFGYQQHLRPIVIMCGPECGAVITWVAPERVADCECRLA